MKSVNQTRRWLLAASGAAVLAPGYAVAQAEASARALGERMIARLADAFGGNSLEPALRALFADHADASVIAQAVLASRAQTADPAAMRAFARACTAQMATELARRLQPFAGGRISLGEVRPVRSYHEVVARLAAGSGASGRLVWHVSDRSGQMRFFNVILDQENMLALGRVQVEDLMSRHGGDLSAVTRSLGG